MEKINTELKQFIEKVRDTCLIKLKKNEDVAVLYYKSGKLTELKINDNYGKNKFDEILTWGNATFEKIKIDTITKFKSEDLKYIFDIIEFNGISSDIYIKPKRAVLVLGFSEGALVSVMPEVPVTKDFINELINVKGNKIRMKLTGEKNGEIKIFISEILA